MYLIGGGYYLKICISENKVGTPIARLPVSERVRDDCLASLDKLQPDELGT